MEVICLQEAAFYALIDKVFERLKEQYFVKEEKWVTGPEAMKKLGISSKTTLQKLRNERAIKFSQPEKKIILYNIDSIDDYLNRFVKS